MGRRLLAMLSNVWPRFAPSAYYGLTPFEVSFTDSSVGEIVTWHWDFDGDGVIDSTEPSPTWTYHQPGIFDVSLEVSDGVSSRTMVRPSLVWVALGPETPRRPAGRLGR